MTLKSGTGQACAACKYQRRRCTPECLLAPFFPADQPKIFQNVHRLFGVKHIQNLLKELDPNQKAMAMRSIKFHAAMRDKYPVYGCLVEIQQLYYQIQLATEELQAVHQQLLVHRQQQHSQHEMPPVDEYLSQLQLGMGPPGNANMSLVENNDNDNNNNNNNNNNDDDNNNNQQQPQQYNVVTAPQNGNYINNANFGSAKENNDVEELWIQYSNNENANSMVMQSQLTTSEHITIPQEINQDYNEMHPFFDNIDDRQSYIGSREAYGSSLESSLKDTRQSVEQMAENELKSAAACFSLTSVNK